MIIVIDSYYGNNVSTLNNSKAGYENEKSKLLITNTNSNHNSETNSSDDRENDEDLPFDDKMSFHQITVLLDTNKYTWNHKKFKSILTNKT